MCQQLILDSPILPQHVPVPSAHHSPHSAGTRAELTGSAHWTRSSGKCHLPLEPELGERGSEWGGEGGGGWGGAEEK